MGKQTLLLALIGTLLAGTTLYLTMQASSASNVSGARITPAVIQQWKKFRAMYNKKYSDPDLEVYRLEIFADNLERISEDKTGTLGVTVFADLSHEEFVETYLTLHVPKRVHSQAADACAADVDVNVNWVSEGKVTPVKNQQRCGSCWAFSAVGALESAVLVAGEGNVNTLNLSEQQLVDCSTQNGGCNGGWMDYAFDYIEANGLTTNALYPYVGVDQACQNPTEDLTFISSYVDVAANCVSDLKVALSQQPVAVAVDASNWSLYSKGVFSNCGKSLNHGVLLVAVENGVWTIKNSWGPNWGVNGFIQLAAGNTCGVAAVASYPLV